MKLLLKNRLKSERIRKGAATNLAGIFSCGIFSWDFVFDRVNDLCAASHAFVAVLVFAAMHAFTATHAFVAALVFTAVFAFAIAHVFAAARAFVRRRALARRRTCTVSLCGETVVKKYFRG